MLGLTKLKFSWVILTRLTFLCIVSALPNASACWAGQLVKDIGNSNPPMVLISAGPFSMGSDTEDPDEKPQHLVTLKAFYLDKYEVTVASYHVFLAESGRAHPNYWELVYLDEQGNLPVAGASWHDATAYCSWAGKRLPTEAEWEKGARGIHGWKYPWGDEDPTPRMTNFNQLVNPKDLLTYSGLYHKYLAPVGSYEADRSPFQVYDMGGNLREWTNDWLNQNYYAQSPQRNPQGPGIGEYKVVRGGAFDLPTWNLRTSLRTGQYPEYGSWNIGFRCAKDDF